MMKNVKNNKSFFKTYLPWILFAVIILIAVFFRFYKLNTLPPGLHPDEAANGLDIFRILENQDYKIIYNTNGPREALFFYLQAVFVYFMGNTILALRMAPAFFGVVSVIALFFATKEWANKRTALVTAFFFAISPWVVIIQRNGFRASMVPLFIALVMLFAAKAYKTGKLIHYILAAVFLGLGFYTYTAFSMILAALLFGFGYLLVMRRAWLKASWKKLLLSLAVFGLVMTPLIVTTINDPGGSTARAGGTSFLNRELNQGQPLQTFLSGTVKSLLQYNYVGDQNNRHNLSGQPLLNMFVGIMFILGLVMAFYNFKRPRYAMLLAIFGAMLLPEILTAEGLPHALRAIGTAVPVFILAGMGVNYLLFVWYKTFPINKLARVTGLGVILLLMGLSLVQSYRQYFVAWAQDSKTYEAYSEGSVAIANYLLDNSNTGRKVFILMGGYEANPIQYLTHNKANYQLLSNKELKDLPINEDKRLIIVPVGNDSAAQIQDLKAKFPEGKLVEIRSSFSDRLLFSTYEVR